MNKKVVWGVVIVVIIIISWFLASPLFIDKTVNEEFPVNSDTNPNEEPETDPINSNILLQGQFIDADSFHQTSGQALIVSDSGTNYLRLENFETTNGPDLFIYLTNDLDAEDYVSLGRLKGNQGNQNYEIPEGINPENYQYAVVWCRAFSVLFGSAELQ